MNPLEFVLRKMDVFYVPFTPNLNLKNKEIESSSVIGGLITLIIYCFSFTYGVILLKQWYFYEMPFKVATQVKNSQDDFFNNYFTNNPFFDQIIVYIIYNVDNGVDFFKNDEAIFIPLLFDWKSNQTISLLNQYDLKSQSFTFDIEAGLIDTQKIFFLVSCAENEMYLDSTQKCASKETIEERISLAGIEIDFEIETKGLDIQTKNISSCSPYTLSFIQKDYSSAKFISFEYTHYKFREGFFQEKQSEYMLKTNFQVRDQMGTLDYLTQYSQYYNPNVQKVYSALWIDSSNAINDILVSYPTISEQLASIGSITQVLLFIGIIIRFFNRKQMIQQFKKEFRSKFFPDLELIEKKRIGKQYQYFYQHKKINSRSYEEFIKETETKIDEKINYFNLIYEVSRIQMILEEITTQYKILQSHLKHFELDLVYCRSDKEYHILNYWGLKSESQFLKKKQSLAPFSLNYSTFQQSEQFCKTLNNEPDQATHITLCTEQKYSSVRFCESKSFH